MAAKRAMANQEAAAFLATMEAVEARAKMAILQHDGQQIADHLQAMKERSDREFAESFNAKIRSRREDTFH